MKAKVIGKVSLETIRRIKRTCGKKAYKCPGFHMPFAGLSALVWTKGNGGDHGKSK